MNMPLFLHKNTINLPHKNYHQSVPIKKHPFPLAVPIPHPPIGKQLIMYPERRANKVNFHLRIAPSIYPLKNQIYISTVFRCYRKWVLTSHPHRVIIAPPSTLIRVIDGVECCDSSSGTQGRLIRLCFRAFQGQTVCFTRVSGWR